MLRIRLNKTMEVPVRSVDAIVAAAAAENATAPCSDPASALATGVAALFLRPHTALSAAFPLESCSCEETTGLSWPKVRSTGIVRYRRPIRPDEDRKVELSYVVVVPDAEESSVREYARTRIGGELGWQLASAVDDVVSAYYDDAFMSSLPGVEIVDYDFDLEEDLEDLPGEPFAIEDVSE
jgi:hypothetical protein